MAYSKSARTEDFFSNVPDIVIDKILECLPIHVAARTSVLSKQWRCSWLSLNSPVFDSEFWNQQRQKSKKVIWQKGSSIISSILLHHNGPVYNFHLHIAHNSCGECINHSQWLCYLSKNNVKKIVIRNSYPDMTISSFIFWCNELVHLELDYFILSPPPTGFSGYRNLKHLELVNIFFSKENVFCSLLANCNVQSLKTLILNGDLEDLAFRNVCNLESVSMNLGAPKEPMTAETKDVVNILANSCQIQFIDFGGYMWKFLAAGGIKNSPPVAFNYLNELCLSDLYLNEFGVFRYVLDMVDCCPNIKKLNILVVGGNLEQHELDYSFSIKLNHLLEVKIKGVTGSSAELKLIEYLLAISVVLEKLFVTSKSLDDKSEVKLFRELMGFPKSIYKGTSYLFGKVITKPLLP
ncbi:hypothetical protein RND81_11G053700 [Saponaria officinalis]|uniref:F-box domain-containing protein n=1 Tax=Saponaria officinalis TaxID=3572 RepID=A0AAW1HIM8_SAPOF